MRPWQHAKSSAAKSGRDWRQDLPIHEFMDITKTAHADLRHRMVLHNVDLGARLAASAFPTRTDASSIARRHVREDMGCEPALHDWLSGCDVQRLPTPALRRRGFPRDDLIQLLTERLGLATTDEPTKVANILLLPRELAPGFGDAPLAVLCNSIGPLIVRQILGPPYEAPRAGSGTAIFDPAWTAEAMIVWIMGRRIPLLSEVVGMLRSVPQCHQESAGCRPSPI